jgi:PAS domain-containing protein
MVVELIKNQSSLYDTDYNLWILETVKQLENRDFNAVDWENLIEEVLDLSKRDKQKLESLLMRLIEHLLKLAYWESERQRNQGHWQGEIRNFRKQIKRLLRDSPSLKPYLQSVFEECYQDSREIVSDKSQLPLHTFPENEIASLEQILDEDWLP